MRFIVHLTGDRWGAEHGALHPGVIAVQASGASGEAGSSVALEGGYEAHKGRAVPTKPTLTELGRPTATARKRLYGM